MQKWIIYDAKLHSSGVNLKPQII